MSEEEDDDLYNLNNDGVNGNGEIKLSTWSSLSPSSQPQVPQANVASGVPIDILHQSTTTPQHGTPVLVKKVIRDPIT